MVGRGGDGGVLGVADVVLQPVSTVGRIVLVDGGLSGGTWQSPSGNQIAGSRVTAEAMAGETPTSDAAGASSGGEAGAAGDGVAVGCTDTSGVDEKVVEKSTTVVASIFVDDVVTTVVPVVCSGPFVEKKQQTQVS